MTKYFTITTLITVAVWLSQSSHGAIDTATATQKPVSSYADTGWVSMHGGRGNHDYLDINPAASYRLAWSARELEHASVLTAPIVGPSGLIYQSSGRAQGHANLFAYNAQGQLMHQTPPWQTLADFDSGATLGSPIIDREGDIYISDRNQLWAFKPDLTTKWVVDLPPAPSGSPWNNRDATEIFNPFITALFTRAGNVAGVTAFGHVVIASRATGQLLAPIFQLPGPAAPTMTEPKLAATLWGSGEIDPAIKEAVWHVALGSQVVSANTPALDTRGYMYVIATDTNPKLGALYKLKLPSTEQGSGDHKPKIEVACQATVGVGSGTSPTLTLDERLVIVSDNDGYSYGVRTSDCAIEWKTFTASEAASSSVGTEGLVYLPTNQFTLVAVDENRGDIRWHSDFSKLAQQVLPKVDGWFTRLIFGPAKADVIGITTVTPNGLLVPVTFGYPLTFKIAGRTLLIPIKAAIVQVDSITGKTENILADISASSEGFSTLNNRNPLLLQTYGCIFTSILSPLKPLADWLLKPYKQSMMANRCGLEAFQPSNTH